MGQSPSRPSRRATGREVMDTIATQATPEWRAIDKLAKANFQRQWGDTAQWHGRKTNRAYYRRRAAAELKRAATQPQSNGE